MKAQDVRTADGIRTIPRWCMCDWVPDFRTRPATWRLTVLARGCTVHFPRKTAGRVS